MDCPLGCRNIEKPLYVCRECIEKEEAWQKIECYMECHDIELSHNFLREYYLSYYVKGLYCNPIMKDIYENNKEECKFYLTRRENM